ncbi:MAG: arginine repressor [Clostridiales bacterium]|jgi:transcriptional regulator of arginine metabolism|nr:arginine repressor [Clostridiales bacterium]
MKSARHEKILDLIESHEIETQEELLKRLAEHGFETAQGTVSRDIRSLGIVKAQSRSGRLVYRCRPRVPETLLEEMISAEMAGAVLVLKTRAGLAMALAAEIDAMRISGILGTIAGDDTVFCAVKNDKDGQLAKKRLTGGLNP